MQAPRQDLSDVPELPEREMQADQSTHDPLQDEQHQSDWGLGSEHPEHTTSTTAESFRRMLLSSEGHL